MYSSVIIFCCRKRLRSNDLFESDLERLLPFVLFSIQSPCYASFQSEETGVLYLLSEVLTQVLSTSRTGKKKQSWEKRDEEIGGSIRTSFERNSLPRGQSSGTAVRCAPIG